MPERTIDRRAEVRRIMAEFAERTGLIPSGREATRYLWTDAFAVCNFLGMFVGDGDVEARRLAVSLVDQVHHVLGRHRPDDARQGWISGLDDAAGEVHPTIGGLRIGKRLPERSPGEPRDEVLEWDRDGQYFHYLTKWMRALDRVARVTGDAKFLRWAVELARAAFARFTYPVSAAGARRMYWKMSVDLTRPQVASMGHHDPLDGLITCCELDANPSAGPELGLGAEIGELTRMCRGSGWATEDALGIGGLLSDAYTLAQLATARPDLARLQEELLRDALHGLRLAGRSGLAIGHAEHRLGFRELGLSIGLHALQALRRLLERRPREVARREPLQRLLDELARYELLAAEIESFWLQPGNRRSRTWLEHRDINDVMLATSLVPSGFLALDGGAAEVCS